MNTYRTRLLALTFSSLLLLVLLLLLTLANRTGVDGPPAITYREVLIAQSPPPPPPPMRTQTDSLQAPSVDLDLSWMEAPTVMQPGISEIIIPAGELSASDGRGLGDNPGLEYISFNLSELDQVPMVVYDPGLAFPESFIERGISTFQTLLHIRIDQSGNATLIQVLQTDYPEMNNALREFVSKTRFTPPTLSGIPVKADFSWPVEHKLCTERNC